MIPWTNESVWLDAAPENKSGSLCPIFHGSVILPYSLKANWCINITWAYESVWFDAWPQNKNGSLWPIFHGSVILCYILKTYWCINMIPWNNESVWLDALPQNKTVSLWPVFHGSVILPHILKAIWCINMIFWANESVWLDAWPQNKSWSFWPIFHGAVILAYILKTIWCIRPWHWPGVYVSPCSLALVDITTHCLFSHLPVYTEKLPHICRWIPSMIGNFSAFVNIQTLKNLSDPKDSGDIAMSLVFIRPSVRPWNIFLSAQ